MAEYPHKLGEVLGGILCALSDAQYMSDQYTTKLQQTYNNPENPLNPLGVPNAQFGTVKLNLHFAIAEVHEGEKTDPPPSLYIYVDAGTLSDLPPNVISSFEFTLKVEDAEPTRIPPPQ